MLVLAIKPGHSGAIAAVQDNSLLFSLEAEKDSAARYAELHVETILHAVRQVDDVPDVVAVGGWGRHYWHVGLGVPIGVGYTGTDQIQMFSSNFLGKEVTMFSSSHERSHIMMPIGMAPTIDSAPQRAVLVYEGILGAFYLVDDKCGLLRHVPVLYQPGARYAAVYALADPSFPDRGMGHRWEDAGKVMALAAYGDPHEDDPAIVDIVDRLLTREDMHPVPKEEFRASPIYNATVEADVTKSVAAVLNRRIFETFAAAAREHLPRDIPLYISGGCGLNCDWNHGWRETGQFSSVFVPPCTDDSGSAIGTAIDAISHLGGERHIEWDVYSGLEFDFDTQPDPSRWERRALKHDRLAGRIAQGSIVGWVQGRWEIGPRALGNRSILAEPFRPSTRERLNHIKQREGYRPIAPCCRMEDVATLFTGGDFEDPYMLYFRAARSKDLQAVTHVDGSARVQTVTHQTNKGLHDLLGAFAAHSGVGALCNTSLNFKGLGFINRMSHLTAYSEARGLDEMVVDDVWFSRRDGASA